MINVLFFKRVFSNKIYWLSVMTAILLLFCSAVHTDDFSGKTYTFLSLFYDDTAKGFLQNGMISMHSRFMGYDASYLWMFCPIIVGVPCVFSKKIERFVLFRISKNKYYLSKYATNLLLGGMIMLLAYVVFFAVGFWMTKESWDMLVARKLLSVFFWGALNVIPSVILSEFVENKYLILCIPFVINYFMCMFMGSLIPFEIWNYISPWNYQILFLYDAKQILICSLIMLFLLVACGIGIKVSFERRCDCGQK